MSELSNCPTFYVHCPDCDNYILYDSDSIALSRPAAICPVEGCTLVLKQGIEFGYAKASECDLGWSERRPLGGFALCPIHKTTMERLRVGYPKIKFEGRAYHCASEHCSKFFDDAGYFDVIDQQVRRSKNRHPCQHCGLPMYLAEVQEDADLWCCQDRVCATTNMLARPML